MAALDAADVLIALETTGVGPWDADIRAGWYPSGKPYFPLVLGVYGAGAIVAEGSRVRRLKVGDKVYSYSWANPKASTPSTSPSRPCSHRQQRIENLERTFQCLAWGFFRSVRAAIPVGDRSDQSVCTCFFGFSRKRNISKIDGRHGRFEQATPISEALGKAFGLGKAWREHDEKTQGGGDSCGPTAKSNAT
jgi:hypothetical protein